MEIYPATLNSTGTILQVPPLLQPALTGWGSVQFISYEFGSVLTQNFRARHFQVQSFRFNIEKPAQLKLKLQQPAICLHFILQGSIMSFVGFSSRTYSLLYLPTGEQRFKLEPGQHEIFSIQLAPTLLEELCESNQEIKALVAMQQSGSNTIKPLEPLNLNYRIRCIIEEMRKCTETGINLEMELGTAVVNLLNLYRKGLNNTEYVRSILAAPYEETLISISEEISQDPNKLQHTMAYFAQKHSMSESTLKRAFKSYYNKSLGEYVTEACMKKAAWLTQDPNLSIDDITRELGYSERSGFIRAYKRYHGKNPKRDDSG